jgi:hypothetical protein
MRKERREGKERLGWEGEDEAAHLQGRIEEEDGGLQNLLAVQELE